MKKVFLRFYDIQNLGDDLFFHIITNRYADQFTIVSKAPYPLLDRPNVKVVSNIFWLLFFRFIEKYIYPKNFLQNALIDKNDLYVYIGGSLFIDNNDNKHWQRERIFYKQLKKPYYILGSNFGPAKSKNFVLLVHDILQGARDVCFRDSATYDIFKDLANTRLSTDVAFTLDTRPYVTTPGKTAILSIINCRDRFDESIANAYEEKIMHLSKELSNKGYNVVLMSFCKLEGDETAIQNIYNRMTPDLAKKISIYNYKGNLNEALRLLAVSEIIVGSRFHATVLGLLFNKKVLPMAYSDKTINLLGDLGFKGKIIDIRTINTLNEEAFDFNAIRTQDVTYQVRIAQKQFRELDKVLVKK